MWEWDRGILQRPFVSAVLSGAVMEKGSRQRETSMNQNGQCIVEI